MSSNSAANATGGATREGEPRRALGAVWPAGSRGVLGALAAVCAVGLMMASGAVGPSRQSAGFVAPELRLDPNTAPSQVLGALPNVGPALVRQLIAARQQRPLDSLEDAGRRVRGLGPATLVKIAPHLRLKAALEAGGSKPAAARGTRTVQNARASRRKTYPKGPRAAGPTAPDLLAQDAHREGF
jgi:competence protein ComEA